MPREWEVQLPASATAQPSPAGRGQPVPSGAEETTGCTGEHTEVGSSSGRREEEREIVERGSSEAYKPYSELLE